jgi:hypothetical protein
MLRGFALLVLCLPVATALAACPVVQGGAATHAAASSPRLPIASMLSGDGKPDDEPLAEQPLVERVAKGMKKMSKWGFAYARAAMELAEENAETSKRTLPEAMKTVVDGVVDGVASKIGGSLEDAQTSARAQREAAKAELEEKKRESRR